MIERTDSPLTHGHVNVDWELSFDTTRPAVGGETGYA
jgi:hypothetical protein